MSRAKFEVWKNVKAAFGGLGETLGALEWHPVMAFFLIFVLFEVNGFLISFWERKGDLEMFSPSAQIILVIYNAALIYALAPLGVAVHRQVLLSESPTKSYLRMFGEGRVCKFAIVGFVLETIIFQVPNSLISHQFYIGKIGVPFLIAYVWLIIGCFIVARIWLIFPAIAVDAHDPRINKAWQDTSGNTWRILFGFLLVILPLSILYVPLGLAIEAVRDNMAMLFALNLISAAWALVTWTVSIRFLSLVFRDRANLLTSTPAYL